MTDHEDLIERLLTLAGIIMEDASAAILLSDLQQVDKRIKRLQQVALDLIAIGAAIAVVARHEV